MVGADVSKFSFLEALHSRKWQLKHKFVSTITGGGGAQIFARQDGQFPKREGEIRGPAKLWRATRIEDFAVPIKDKLKIWSFTD